MEERSRLEKLPKKMLQIILKKLESEGWGRDGKSPIGEEEFWERCLNICQMLSIKELDFIDYSFLSELLILNLNNDGDLIFPKVTSNSVTFWEDAVVRQTVTYNQQISSYSDDYETLTEFINRLVEDGFEYYDTDNQDVDVRDTDVNDTGFEID